MHNHNNPQQPTTPGTQSNVVGILYAKDLVLVNPLDELELSTLVGFRGHQVGRTYAHERLDRVLQVPAPLPVFSS